MRSSPLLLAVLLLAGCGAPASQQQNSASPTVGVPTATPVTFGGVLVQAGGSMQDYHSRAFYAPHGWEVIWSQHCSFVQGFDPEGGILQFFADNPATPRGAELAVAYSVSPNHVTKSSSSGLQPGGHWILHVTAAPGCRWHAKVRAVA